MLTWSPRFASLVGLALMAALGSTTNPQARADAESDAAETRRSLRQQGFKTDLSDFDFSTDHETAVRAAALTNLHEMRPTLLMKICGTESAIVAWKQPNLEEEEGYQNVPAVEEVLAKKRLELDLACAAALAGPIRFPLMAEHGSGMLLPHLATLRSLSQALAARMIVELQAERYGAAWTNLLALTRLATAWEPEPSDISHLVRFNLAKTAYQATWQALQARHWTAEQLAALQREWEAPDFFKLLPQTAAFMRASMVNTCISERTNPAPGIPLKDTLQNALRSPSSLPNDVKQRLDRSHYRTTGTYEDEKDLLLFFRDRELQLRKAITASTWQQMRMLPGVTNPAPFRSKYSSAMQAMFNMRQLSVGMQLRGNGLLGRAAETESRRRLVVAAIALERYRLTHGSYPQDLSALVPEVLKSVPLDFMDGNPLRYRLSKPDAFVLYSIGLDCADDRGHFSTTKPAAHEFPMADPSDTPDLIWPRAASDAEFSGLLTEEASAKTKLRETRKQEAAADEKEREERRQAIIVELARLYAKREVPRIPDPKLKGGLLSELLRNKANPPLRLAQMLTLRQVITGEEPDIATFELPISYDAVTNIGDLQLLCDADPNEKWGGVAELQECTRATNGNCRLIWNTTYDPPGRHYLQAMLMIDSWRSASRRRNQDPEETVLKGPLFEFTSTNVLQYLTLGDMFSDKGAYFRVKLAQPAGSYSLKLTNPSGEHIRTFTGSTTNGIVEIDWDLTYDGGKRYTNDSFESTWTVTFPDPPNPVGTKQP